MPKNTYKYILLYGEYELIYNRIINRNNHFFRENLSKMLQNQFDTLDICTYNSICDNDNIYKYSNVKNDKMSDDKDSNNNTYSNMTNTINSTNICYNTTRNTFTNKKNNNNNSNSNNENVCKRIHIAENIEENLILVNIENSVEDIVNYIFESSCK